MARALSLLAPRQGVNHGWPPAGLWCREHESYCAHLAEAFGETHFEQLAQAVAERDVQLASELAGELGRRNADMLALSRGGSGSRATR